MPILPLFAYIKLTNNFPFEENFIYPSRGLWLWPIMVLVITIDYNIILVMTQKVFSYALCGV